jgi:predicted O-linked N-acetylglucosamine transferase (SPINDLY family)
MQVTTSPNKIDTHCSLDLSSMFSSINLERTVEYYEQLITQDNGNSYNYWYLGLAYLLQQLEVDAQATWFIPFAEASELETIALTDALSNILNQVADLELVNRNLTNSWLISQYLQEVDPTHLNNLFRSIILAIELDLFEIESLLEWQAIEILSDCIDLQLDFKLLNRAIELLLSFPDELTHEFIYQCLRSSPAFRPQIIELISNQLLRLSHRSQANSFMIQILETCLKFQPQDTVILQVLCGLHCSLLEYSRAIDISFMIYNLCRGSAEKIIANANIIRTLLTAGDWQNVMPIIDRHYQLFDLFINEQQVQQVPLAPAIAEGIMVSATFLPYATDRPSNYRAIQNQISQLYLNLNREVLNTAHIKQSALSKQTGILRVGYLASTLRSHSVGWLSRWLWQYHDHNRFQIFTYCINQNSDDPFYQKWFRDQSDITYCLGINPNEIAAQIKADEIDILIDLDSLTLDITCQVLSMKPAPIQLSWLGWDATGLPTVDYFIADPYVLPDTAQDYYAEKIWRLPQTYLAVNGFEVGTPTIRRKDLDISDDAVIYWSGQRGYKRHPQTIRLQMQILKLVPNSYLLIKGESDRHTIEELFGAIAQQVGVNTNRLRFLDTVADELTHRANLTIADIVLDTFPYNGATTTLETLWMGIPMVTQVGQQFAARNSYTFMRNAGLQDEGIAWSAEEYVEWGVKLGLDRDLRLQVREKLRLGRANAPVWNAKQFTLDMEQAYQEMWTIHQAKNQAQIQHDAIELN